MKCDRCGATLQNTYGISGIAGSYGPECVHIVARESGIAYDVKKYGVGAFDSAAMALAIEMNRYEKGRFAFDRNARREQKRIVGTIGWKIAQAISAKRALRLNTLEALKCYQAATKR